MSTHRLCAVWSRLLVLCAATIAALLLGCSTTRKVDWDTRIGNYTYDEAVGEFGPPDKQATLSNASTVAEWVTPRLNGIDVSVGQPVASESADHWLQLTFSPEGVLSSWSRN